LESLDLNSVPLLVHYISVVSQQERLTGAHDSWNMRQLVYPNPEATLHS